uniref:Ribosomal RNA-processing protein 43 n=1 Tax=Chenopodium quinoa TaxID=63459 RepID=A0A803MAC1_CHEQI
MGSSMASSDLSADMEIDAFRRLFPVQFYERHFVKSLRPDARTLNAARDTTVALGAVSSANGSALVKIGCTTMLAAVKMEIMTPSTESPDEGNLAIEFHMPPICSPLVRPGRPADAAPVISKQLADTILSSGMINLKELCLVSGKAAWMAYLDICCLDADGALFDAALLSAVAAFSNLRIPVVSLNDEGRVFIMSEEMEEGKSKREPVNNELRKLTLSNIPFSLSCVLHKNYILADPTAEEESIIETSVTVDCVALTKQRVQELQQILSEAISDMEVD